jgi:hypothetical protein
VIERRLSTTIRTYAVLPMSDARTFARRREADDVGAAMTVELAVGMVGRNQALEQKAALLCHYIRLELIDWRASGEGENRSRVVIDPMRSEHRQQRA